ncbi:DUF6694 family lipoprotein [Candidatus Schmidhempelia bombi]|uniref:Lipoprotein n=1 Tax=Candidatus Schmidhempelia bombi str. Bimp TaxID=1387197 RepID=A0AB94IA82_9GAMM|nr:DUF6694 family lipoprotein [Candidatus Schmidhempelia bombi]TEA26289.1 hypothetical protein O970_09520 [Candidatus Schmidhempelia bombi str. Bimp]
MLKKLLAISLLSFFLIACGDDTPKFDLSSIETYETSGKRVVEKLNDADKENLARVIIKLSIAAGLNMENEGDQDKIFAEIRRKLDGKTAKEIINEFDK